MKFLSTGLRLGFLEDSPEITIIKGLSSWNRAQATNTVTTELGRMRNGCSPFVVHILHLSGLNEIVLYKSRDWGHRVREPICVQEYILLAALLHVFVALKRTWDISMNYSAAHLSRRVSQGFWGLCQGGLVIDCYGR